MSWAELTASTINGPLITNVFGETVRITLNEGDEPVCVEATFDPEHEQQEIGDAGTQITNYVTVIQLPREHLPAGLNKNSIITIDSEPGRIFTPVGQPKIENSWTVIQLQESFSEE